MRVQAISPRQLSHYVAPIMQSRVTKSSSVKKSSVSKKTKRQSHSVLVDESINNLSTQLEVVEDESLFNEFHRRYEPEINTSSSDKSQLLPTLDIEQGVDKSLIQNTLSEAENNSLSQPSIGKKELADVNSSEPSLYSDVEIDPEEEMAQARFDQAKMAIPEFELTPFNPSLALNRIEAISGFGIHVDSERRLKPVFQDKFSYFTLVEALIIYNILFEKLPKKNLSISFGLEKINKRKQQLESSLHIYHRKSSVKQYRIIYDIVKTAYTVFDKATNTIVGDVNFDIDNAHYYLEEAIGKIEGKRLLLDPVWEVDDPSKMRYQVLQIGHRKLDLTSVSKKHRKGLWSFKPNEEPIYFDEVIESHETKKNHIVTKKNIKVGKAQLKLTLKFFDDVFTEPYAVSGKITF